MDALCCVDVEDITELIGDSTPPLPPIVEVVGGAAVSIDNPGVPTARWKGVVPGRRLPESVVDGRIDDDAVLILLLSAVLILRGSPPKANPRPPPLLDGARVSLRKPAAVDALASRARGLLYAEDPRDPDVRALAALD